MIRATTDPDVNIIFGAVIDPNLEGELQITVIATGFEEGAPEQGPLFVSRPQVQEFPRRTYSADDLDIPAFLRRS